MTSDYMDDRPDSVSGRSGALGAESMEKDKAVGADNASGVSRSLDVKRRLFDVTVTGYGSAIYEAPTRGKALADAWRCDAFNHFTFKQFMRISRARVRRDPPPTDGYGYVRERYGMDPKVGGRARINRGEGKHYEGREGEILWAGMARYNHIRILLDGDKEPLNFHPSNVILLPSSPAGATLNPQESASPASPTSLEASKRPEGATTESARVGEGE